MRPAPSFGLIYLLFSFVVVREPIHTGLLTGAFAILGSLSFGTWSLYSSAGHKVGGGTAISGPLFEIFQWPHMLSPCICRLASLRGQGKGRLTETALGDAVLYSPALRNAGVPGPVFVRFCLREVH